MCQTDKHLLGFRQGVLRGTCVAVLFAMSFSGAGMSVAAAQTVSSVSPLVSSGSYTVSSSPLPNGGRVQTVYYPPQMRQVDPRGSVANPSGGVVTERVTSTASTYGTSINNGGVDSSMYASPTYTSPTYTASSSREAAYDSQRPTTTGMLTNTGWRSVGTRSEVVTTNYQQPISPAPQLRSVPQNQTPSTSTNMGSSNYYNRTTTNYPGNASFQGGTPAASTPPTLSPTPNVSSGGVFPPNTMVQGSTLPGSTSPTVVTQPQNGLNWQPMGANGVYPSSYRYTTNGVCTPVNAQYVNATCGNYRPYTSYRPLLPLRRMPGNAYLGQGLYGQPKAYVDGENVRNFFRYILP